MPLHDYQQEAHEKAVATLLAGGKKLYVAPTGSGKSYIQAANHVKLHTVGSDLLSVAPSTEIALGIYDKLPIAWRMEGVRDWNEEKQQRECERLGIWTIMRLYNELMSGRLDPPKMLQFDEAHHTTADTYEAVHALCGDCPAIAYTATGFRGTPDETAKLRAKWGEPEPILSLGAAVKRGVVARPDFGVWPLVNDETIKITNGEFETKAVEKEVKKVMPALVKRIVDEFFDVDTQHWKRTTMVTAPGVATAGLIADQIEQHCNLKVHGDMDAGTRFAWAVTGATKARQEAFRAVTAREQCLVQVNVVSEGVDLPIRVHVDTAPCMSPVRWMQRVGRGTRPVKDGEERPLYICTNHNLTRHAYLWAGVIPSAQIRDAQKAWGDDFEPSRRMFARALGLEGFGKFVVARVPLVDGSYAGLYALQTKDGTHQYAVLLHPCRADPLYFQRTNPYTGELAEKELPDGKIVQYKKKDYGKWKKIASIPNADGYVSVKPQKITDPMLAWWRGERGRGAEWCGLDPNHEPDAREFQALPVLLNTGIQFKPVEEPC